MKDWLARHDRYFRASRIVHLFRWGCHSRLLLFLSHLYHNISSLSHRGKIGFLLRLLSQGEDARFVPKKHASVEPYFPMAPWAVRVLFPTIRRPWGQTPHAASRAVRVTLRR